MEKKTPAAPAAFDLDDFEDLQTATVVLKNPVTGEPTSSTIEIVGPEHPTRQGIVMARARRIRAEFQKTGKVPVSDPVEDVEADTDLLVSSVTGWNLTQGGKPLEFSAAAARALFTDPRKQWVRVQVRKALDEAERFIRNSSKA